MKRLILCLTVICSFFVFSFHQARAQNGGYATCPDGAAIAVSLAVPEPYLNSPGDHAVGILRAQYSGGGGFIETVTMTLSIYPPGSGTPAQTVTRVVNLLNLGSSNLALDFKTPCSPTGSWSFKGSVSTTGSCSPNPIGSLTAYVNPNALCQP